MAINSTSITPTDAKGSYLWTFSGCPIQIEIELQVVECISREVLQDSGCETGGLLLGRADLRESRTIAITGYEPLWQAHRDSSQLELSPAEIASLEARLSSDIPAAT